MGTAFGVCFTYWIGGAMFIWVLSYISNVHIALLQIMSMMVSRFIIYFRGTAVDLQLPVQLVPITTKVVSSNPAHGDMNSIQHYVIKFVSDLR